MGFNSAFKGLIFWDVTPRSLLKVYLNFVGKDCLYVQGRALSDAYQSKTSLGLYLRQFLLYPENWWVMSLLKIMIHWKPEGRKKRGRPRRTWKDGIYTAMNERDLRMGEQNNRRQWNVKVGRRRQMFNTAQYKCSAHKNENKPVSCAQILVWHFAKFWVLVNTTQRKITKPGTQKCSIIPDMS